MRAPRLWAWALARPIGLAAIGLAALGTGAPGSVHAQVAPGPVLAPPSRGITPIPDIGSPTPRDRPGDRPLELPAFEPPEEPLFELPSLPPPAPDAGALSQGPKLRVDAIDVVGSTVFDAATLAELTRPYTGREVSAGELLALRDALTRLYIDAGYLNSGAVLPDQRADDGRIELHVVEGQLTRIELSGNAWFRDGYLTSRVERGAGQPLNVSELETRLQLLQQDARIRRVDARLGPGERPGESVLQLDVEEARPWWVSLQFANEESPAIGSMGPRLFLGHDNLSGNGDTLLLNAAITDGLRDYQGRYALPLNRWDTTLALRGRYSTSEVVEEPFDVFDIQSKAYTAAVELRQPVLHDVRQRLEAFAFFEYRESKNFLLGQPFNFSPASEDGVVRVAVVRLGGDWVFRDLTQVFAVRSTLSIGVDALGSTVTSDGIEDSKFLVWLGQFQWARRFDRAFGTELLVRFDVQLSNSALPSLEQFAIGGVRTVRGYRTNQLVRDNGLVFSIEPRIPLWSTLNGPLGGPFRIEFVPFFDLGHSWNTERAEPGIKTLYGIGAGFRFRFTRHFEAEVYYAEALEGLPRPPDNDLQDEGFYFRVVLTY